MHNLLVSSSYLGNIQTARLSINKILKQVHDVAIN